MLSFELLALCFPLESAQLVVDGLGALVLIDVSQQVAQLSHAVVFGVEAGFYAA